MKTIVQTAHTRPQVSTKMTNEDICRGRVRVRIGQLTLPGNLFKKVKISFQEEICIYKTGSWGRIIDQWLALTANIYYTFTDVLDRYITSFQPHNNLARQVFLLPTCIDQENRSIESATCLRSSGKNGRSWDLNPGHIPLGPDFIIVRVP